VGMGVGDGFIYCATLFYRLTDFHPDHEMQDCRQD